MSSVTAGAAEVAGPAGAVPSYAIAARIERLPACRALRQIVLLIAVGGWFEFYELFLPSGISTGLVHDGIFTIGAKGFLDFGSFPSFLASFGRRRTANKSTGTNHSDHRRGPACRGALEQSSEG